MISLNPWPKDQEVRVSPQWLHMKSHATSLGLDPQETLNFVSHRALNLWWLWEGVRICTWVRNEWVQMNFKSKVRWKMKKGGQILGYNSYWHPVFLQYDYRVTGFNQLSATLSTMYLCIKYSLSNGRVGFIRGG